ncbi:MAG: hypothetical protein H0M93_04460 [Methanophagales archaeon]|nr:hypothetical protein [Methanophagales archaeon]
MKKREGKTPVKPPHFLSLGFITYDLYENRKIIGGASAYSAILARNFGFDTAIVTSIGKDFEECDSLKGCRLSYQIDERTTTFVKKRVQYVTSIADRIKEETIPDEWFNSAIVYISPVLDELEETIIRRFERSGSLIGVAPQGWMRRVDHRDRGKVSKKSWEKAAEVLSKADFVIVSEEDIFEEDIQKYVELSDIFVLTRGRRGAELYCGGEERREREYEHIVIPAFDREAVEVDATGAGDVFGAAFLLRYYENRDVLESAIFASSAASFVVEKAGVAGIPYKDEVEERMEKYLLR